MGKRWIAGALCVLLAAGSASARAFASDGGSYAPRVSAQAYIVVEETTGRALAAGNESARLPIASTTKILTALLALEQANPHERFGVDPAAIKVEGTSMGLREGDTVDLWTLANGMLLASGNDAANAAAVRIAGSIPGFAELMNRRAAELGMANSHFVTPSGLHSEAHYSSAADMATLARTALQNEDFAAICGQTSAKLQYGNPPFDRWLTNHNRLLRAYPGCIGIKTGFTKKAGRCLVSAARRDGVTLVCVTLNAPNDWNDHARLLDYAFSQVTLSPLAVSTDGLRVKVVGGLADSVPARPVGEAVSCLTAAEQAELQQMVLLPRFCYAPVRRGDAVGTIVHRYRGFEVARTELVAAADVPYQTTPPKRGALERVKDFFLSLFGG